jgi:cytoskeleton protein RodZ
MSEPSSPEGSDRPAAPAASAGALLRAAREAQGLHIAALAAAIKVSPRKLEALEADRYDELPDTTFTRALAQAVARSLKIDPRPVLERLPAAGPQALAPGDGGLNQPFREASARAAAAGGAEPGFGGWRPMLWAAGLLLVAALVLYFLPLDPFGGFGKPAEAPAPASGSAGGLPAPTTWPDTPVPSSGAASAASAAASSPGFGPLAAAGSEPAASAPAANAALPVVETVFAAPPAATAAQDTAPSPPEPPPAGLLVLRSTEPSWVEVVDARGRTLLSRTLLPGERLGLDGALPLTVVVGNAEATELVFRGRVIELSPRGRDNVARLQLR